MNVDEKILQTANRHIIVVIWPLLVIKQDDMKLTYDGDLFDTIELGDLQTVKIYWQEGIEIDYQEKGYDQILNLMRKST